MDQTAEIKARLPIEQLVGQYCQLKKKGRNFICLCPFHQDSNPSLLVSPDKGIAYCFACQTGGDIFSFYQSIEKVDFRQALQDLAEKAGVVLETSAPVDAVKKDEKERARACLEAAKDFYIDQLKKSEIAMKYLKERGMTDESLKEFEIGFAPDSFSDTYQYLLKKGFSKSEIVLSSLGIQKDLSDGKMYDRFRNRIMFPIFDSQNRIAGFGGRTIGEDDAKYINSSDSPIYHKSEVLFALPKAKDAIREKGKVILVEGYFDVVSCHQIGVKNVVAVSGTALTQQHAKVLKRQAETVILCLDQDRAGKDAAERAFFTLVPEDFQVQVVTIPAKDPDEAAKKEPGLLKHLLENGGVSYIDSVLDELSTGDVQTADGKRNFLKRVLPLLSALKSSVERSHFLSRAASALQITEKTLEEDIRTFNAQPSPAVASESAKAEKKDVFSRMFIALGLLFSYPNLRHLVSELIEPESGIEKEMYLALKNSEDPKSLSIDQIAMDELDREKIYILLLYCEHHGFTDWSENMASKEIHHHCMLANQEVLKSQQIAITKQIREARKEGRTAEEAQLSLQYQKVLKLMNIAK